MTAKEHENNSNEMPKDELKGCISKDLLCEHKDSGVPHFALGLCEVCYKDFDKLSGGLGGDLDPHAFQHAERERVKKTLPEESVDEGCALANASSDRIMSLKEDLPAYVPESIRANVEYEATKDGNDDDSYKEDESETLSDIDDQEVNLYLHDEKGKHYKKILWELANREYLEKQARQLATSAHEAVGKSRKEKKQRRAHEAKKVGPAQAATEATGQMLNKKRHLQGLKSKVNFDRLDELFNELEGADDPKKQKKVQSDPPLDNHDNLQSKVEDKNEDEMGSAHEFEYEGDMGEMYQSTLFTENMDDKYFAEDDDYGYGQGYNDFDY